VSIARGRRIAQGGVQALAVVEADVGLQAAFPGIERARSHPIPVLLLHGALHPLHLAVEVGGARPDAGVADTLLAQELGKGLAELRAVVGLEATEGEGERLEQLGQRLTDGLGGAPGDHRGRQGAAAVVDEGDLEAALGEVLQIHLRPLPWPGFSVPLPDGLGLAGAPDEGAGAAEHPVDGAQAATDEAGLPEIGVEAADAEPEAAMDEPDAIEELGRERGRAAPGPARAVLEPSRSLPPVRRPPAGEGRVRDFGRFAEAARAETRMPLAELLEADDVADPCGDGPRCARVVHAGPPCSRLVFLHHLPYSAGPTIFTSLRVSHVLTHNIQRSDASSFLLASPLNTKGTRSLPGLRRGLSLRLQALGRCGPESSGRGSSGHAQAR